MKIRSARQKLMLLTCDMPIELAFAFMMDELREGWLHGK